MRVTCDCLHAFEVPDSLAGGIANCPKCRRATKVEGLRDPYWQLVQIASILIWAAATALAYFLAGLGPAILVAIGMAVAFAVLRLAL